MKRQLTWLSDSEWARIEPLLPRGLGAVAIDATHINAQRSAAGAKGGRRASHRHLARSADQHAARTEQMLNTGHA